MTNSYFEVLSEVDLNSVEEVIYILYHNLLQ